MIQIASGDIMKGVRYTVANEVDGSGTLTYDGIDYIHGDSFTGQTDNDTYTVTTSNIAAYEDDINTEYQTTSGSYIDEEISRYEGEDSKFEIVGAVENFNASDVRFPEDTFYNVVLAYGKDILLPQIINKRRR